MSEDIEQARCGPNVLVPDADGNEHKITLVNTSKGIVLITPSTIVGLAHGAKELPQLIHVEPMEEDVAPLSVLESGIAYGEGGDA